MNAELRIFRQAATKIQSRRDDKNNPDKEAGAWTVGDASLTSAMNHDKTGLIGAVQYWAQGSPIRRDQVITQLIKALKCR